MTASEHPGDSQDQRLIVVGDPDESGEAKPLLEQPGRVMRIAAMTRQLLDEIRRAPLDQESRDELRRIYASSIEQLGNVLSPDLAEELKELSLTLDGDTPSEAELRVAHAQLVGWLEGLFHGIQATLFAQQMENQQRLAEMRQRALPGGAPPGADARPGTYL